MKKLFLSAAALTVLFIACSKDDNNTIKTPDTPQTPETPAPGKYLLHIITPIDSFELTYNAANKISKEGRWGIKDDASLIMEPVYENGKITKMMQSEDGTASELAVTYEYDNAGKLAKVNFLNFYTGGTQTRYDSLFYNADGRLSALYEIDHDNTGDKVRYKYLYTWDSKGNIIKEVRFSLTNGVPSLDSAITDFTYDNKVNSFAKQAEIFQFELELPYFWLSANNVITATETHTTSPTTSIVTTEEYTYDADGYPVAKKEMQKRVENGQVVANAPDEFFRYRYIIR